MGNRAVITWDNISGIYLHWNGGRDSVEAFLGFCAVRKFRDPFAGMCTVINNYFAEPGSPELMSIYTGPYGTLDLDNYDNGVYVCKDYEIVGRRFAPKDDDYNIIEQQEYDLYQMMIAINDKQPEALKVTEEAIKEYVAKFNAKKGEQ